tara:strand:- start:4282 stop:4455 length:174 start_codon:yes stop_codon:yes gene_type:complete
MGEAKRRKELGLPPKEIKKTPAPSKRSFQLSKYPYLPFILGGSLLIILIIDLINFYK